MIKNLSYLDDEGSIILLPHVHFQFLLQTFQLYYVHCRNEGDPIGEDWLSIQMVDFNELCLEIDPAHLQTSPQTSSLVTTPQPCTCNPVLDVKKGIKCDAMLFVTFKDESQCNDKKGLGNA
jgi:hypothetical protein